MFDPYTQTNPWIPAAYATATPYGLGSQPFSPTPFGYGFGWQTAFGPQGHHQGFQGISPIWGQFGLSQIAPQTWYGNPMGSVPFGQFNNPLAQQVLQQIPQLVQNAYQLAQQAPQVVQQIPQLLQQNPQLIQQAPQLQQVPQLLQQAAALAQQVPHVLQALCTLPQAQTVAFGGGGFKPFGYGQTAF